MKRVDQLKQNPWRFKVGSMVFIAGHQQQPAKVAEAFAHKRSGFPHYIVVDFHGVEWTVAQVQLSKLPIAP